MGLPRSSPIFEPDKKTGCTTGTSCFFMRRMGLEPTRCSQHKILSLARLPVPTPPHARFLGKRKSYYNISFFVFNDYFYG